ncbi:hypothetical protein CEXT_421151 [Caerostris extrusa]|uniref:Uncharacterized protein n=1 Tax=Caerostris extrusa TaxID=172846 RepID=A0AAV4MNB7_CAEEX|nr:hypothetical protein CEXT_421151 [Caerostris extrusa]
MYSTTLQEAFVTLTTLSHYSFGNSIIFNTFNHYSVGHTYYSHYSVGHTYIVSTLSWSLLLYSLLSITTQLVTPTIVTIFSFYSVGHSYYSLYSGHIIVIRCEKHHSSKDLLVEFYRFPVV